DCERQTLWLCTRDADVQHLDKTSIGSDEVKAIRDLSGSRRFVVILDCCYSGGFKSVPSADVFQSEGTTFIGSTTAGGRSPDAPHPDQPSPFTALLSGALTLGTLNRSDANYVRLYEIFAPVKRELQVRYGTVPVLSDLSDRSLRELPIARASGYPTTIIRSQTGRPPRLTVHPRQIHLADLPAGQFPRIHTIDVLNLGDGRLDWTAH